MAVCSCVVRSTAENISPKAPARRGGVGGGQEDAARVHVLCFASMRLQQRISKAEASKRILTQKIFTLTDFAGNAPSTFEDGAGNDHRGQSLLRSIHLNHPGETRCNTDALVTVEALALQALASGVITAAAGG